MKMLLLTLLCSTTAWGSTFVYDVGIKGEVECFLEDQANPGRGRANSQPVANDLCERRPGQLVGFIYDSFNTAHLTTDPGNRNEDTLYMNCYLEDASRPGRARLDSRPVNASFCDQHPGSTSLESMRYVYSINGAGYMGCYIENPTRPGSALPDSILVNSRNCIQRPGAGFGGNPTFVYDVGTDGVVGCYMEDPANRGRAMHINRSDFQVKTVHANWCSASRLGQRPSYVFDLNAQGEVGCYLEDPTRIGSARPNSAPVASSLCD